MKINYVLGLISFVLSVLLGFWVYSLSMPDKNAALAGVLSSICFAFPLIIGFCISFNKSTNTLNQRALAAVFFVIMCISHFYYAYNGIKMPYYALINGIIWCLYIAISYSINKVFK